MQTEAVLTVLGDPTRQALLHLLRRGPMPVGELASRLPVTRPAVSQHLRKLKHARLVRERREGVHHYFSLDPVGFAALRQYVDSMWHDALTAFASYVSQQVAKKPTPRRGR
jgi:DNA-binding transcriptional ArsR family regulator